MVTLETSNQLQTSPVSKSLGYDFALLGLKGREARVDVIRGAAERTAARIPDTLDDDQRVELLAELAASTYRLLDPRRRRKPIERILLSLGSENDPALATVSRQPLVAADNASATDPLIIAEVVLPADRTVQLASKVSQDSVSSVGEEKPPRKPNRNSRFGLVCISALATLVASTLLIAWAIVA